MENDPRPFVFYENNKYNISSLIKKDIFEKIDIKDINNYPIKDYARINNINGDLYIQISKYIPIEEKKTRLPYGIYIFENKYDKNYLIEHFQIYDEYINLNNNIIIDLEQNIESFITSKNNYEKLNIIHKRGYLLYGPPGNGKSSLINHIIQKYKQTAYIIYLDSPSEISYLKEIKDFFKENLVFFIFEELSKYKDSYKTTDLLNFLDGPNSWEHCIVLATTNYPQLLPENIIDRPSRFDQVIFIDYPSDDMRRLYVQKLIGNYDEDLILKSKNHSLAYLKELCISNLLNKTNIDEIIKNMNHFKKYAEEHKNKNNLFT